MSCHRSIIVSIIFVIGYIYFLVLTFCKVNFFIGCFEWKGVTKGARDKILISIRKLRDRPDTLRTMEKVSLALSCINLNHFIQMSFILKYAYWTRLGIRVRWSRGRILALQLDSSGFEPDLANAERPWTSCSSFCFTLMILHFMND